MADSPTPTDDDFDEAARAFAERQGDRRKKAEQAADRMDQGGVPEEKRPI